MLESRRHDDRWISRSFCPAFRRALPAPLLQQHPLQRQIKCLMKPRGKPGAKDSPSLEAILRIANNAGHSDVHLGVGERPRFRARGEIQATDWPATDDSVFQGWLHEILSPQQIDSFYRDKELDSAYAFPFVRVRINVLDSLRGPAMVLRLIPQTILTMEDLKLPEVLKDLAPRPKGLVLVTRPTGSGKSTTLAAMIDWINRN